MTVVDCWPLTVDRSNLVDNAVGGGKTVGLSTTAVLHQHQPGGTDDVAVSGGGAAPGRRTSVERLQECEETRQQAVFMIVSVAAIIYLI